MTMKLVIFLSCIVVASAYVVTENQEAQRPQKIEYTESAKLELREAANRIIIQLCLSENVDQQIMDTICVGAIGRKMGRRVPGRITTLDCLDCDVADPICWNSCPE